MRYSKSKLSEPPLHSFKIAGEFSGDMWAAIAKEIKLSLAEEQDVEFFVLDLGSSEIDFKFLRPLTVLGAELKRKKKRLCILSALQSLHRLLTNEGLSEVIKPISSLTELGPAPAAPGEAAGRKKSRIDVSFINPFVDGVLHVLSVQCSITCQPGKPIAKEDLSGTMQSDIAGTIGISSAQFAGSISICFPEKTFLLIMSKMFGEECTKITKDLEDGAGEVLNMVFGHAKKILNENGHSFEKALPTVVRGRDISINHVSTYSSIVLPFTVGDFAFYMEICTEGK